MASFKITASKAAMPTNETTNKATTETIVSVNDNPKGFIINLLTAPRDDTNVKPIDQVVFFDVSGSQAWSPSGWYGPNTVRKGAVETLCTLARAIGTKCKFIPFGADKGTHTRLTADEFCSQFNNPDAFKVATYTVHIEQGLNYYISLGKRFHCILQGDGAFTDPGLLSQIFNNLAQAKKLKFIAQVTIIFSAHTSLVDQDKIVNSLTQICMKSEDIIPVVAHCITNVHATARKGEMRPLHNDDMEFIEKQILNNPGLNTIATPADFLRAGPKIAIHKWLTAASIAKALTDDEKTANKLFDLLKQNAKVCPALLTENEVYSRIYKACSIIFGKAAGDWLGGMITNLATPASTRTALEQMRDNAKQDSNEVELNRMHLQSEIVGYLPFAHNAATSYDILAAMKDITTMATMVKQVWQTALPKIEPAKDSGKMRGFYEPASRSTQMPGFYEPASRSTQMHGFYEPASRSTQMPGFPILKKTASVASCKLALQNMFAQFGNFTFTGLTMYIAGLSAMFSDAQVPKVVYEQLKKALFVDTATTLWSLGANPDTGEWKQETRNKLMAPAICRLIAEALKTFGDLMFPGIDMSKQPAEDASFFTKLAYDIYWDILGTYRIYKIHGFVSRHTSYKVKFMRPVGNIRVRKGMIGLVKPYSGDPQRNLPSWVIIRRVGRNKRTLLVQYFDRVLTKDYTDEYRMPIDRFIPYRAIDSLDEEQEAQVFAEFNAHMCKIQQDGAAGKLGPDMQMGAALNQQVLDTQIASTLQKLDNIAVLANDTYEPVLPVTMEEATRDVTLKEMVDIVASSASLPHALVAFLKTGNKPNAADIDNGKLSVGSVITGCNTSACTTVDSQLQQRIRDDFAKHMTFQPPACLQAGRFWDCSVCLDSFRIGMGTIMACGHAQCNECNKQMRDYVPLSGEQVNMAMCRCAVCRAPVADNAVMKATGNLFLNLLGNEYPMRCSVAHCDSPYYVAHLGCGGDESQLVRTCEYHTPRPVAPLPTQVCPGCEHTIERTYGCDFMTCHCGTYFCFGCGMKLEYNHGDWTCKGSLAACADADEHPGWESD